MCSPDNDEPGCPCLVTWPVGLTLCSQTLCILHIHSAYIYNNSENLQNDCNSRDGHLNTKLSELKNRNLECEYLVGSLAQRPLPLLTWWHYSCRDDWISCSTTSQRSSEQMWRSSEHNCRVETLEIDHLAWRSTHRILLTAQFLTTFWTSLSLEWFTIPSILSPWGSTLPLTTTLWTFECLNFHRSTTCLSAPGCCPLIVSMPNRSYGQIQIDEHWNISLNILFSADCFFVMNVFFLKMHLSESLLGRGGLQ